MLPVSGYFALKYYIYQQINNRLADKIAFSNLKLDLIPLRIQLEDLKNFSIKSKNLISLKRISVEIPPSSLFSSVKEVNLNIHNPVIVLDDKILESRDDDALDLPYEINRLNIIDGELSYTSPDMSVKLLHFNLDSYNQSGKIMYRLRSPHLKVMMGISDAVISLEGDMVAEFRKQLSSWRIWRFLWNTADFRLTMNGRVFNSGSVILNAGLRGDIQKFLTPLVDDFQPMGFVEGNIQIRRKEKEPLRLYCEAVYKSFVFRGEPFGDLVGKVNWNDREKVFHINGSFRDGERTAGVVVDSEKELTKVVLENLNTSRLTRIVEIDEAAPLDGVLRRGEINIRRGVIDGKAILTTRHAAQGAPEERKPVPFQLSAPVPVSAVTTTPASVLPNPFPAVTAPQGNNIRFNMSGEVSFSFDTHNTSLIFSTRNAVTDFGTLDALDGEFHENSSTRLKIKGRASITRAEHLHPFTQFYINVPLEGWKLERGAGTVSLDLKQINGKFFIESDMELRNFTVMSQPVELLKGRLSTKNSLTRGIFEIRDPQLKGRAEMEAGDDYYAIDMKNVEGEASKVMKILEIDLLLSGGMKGDFYLLKKDTDLLPLVTGSFSARRVNFYDYWFDDVFGDLEYQGYSRLKNLDFRFNNGVGRTDFFVDYEKQTYSLEGKIADIDVNRMHPEFTGRVSLDFNGKGTFHADPITLTVNSGLLNFYENRPFSVRGDGKIYTNFEDFTLQAQGTIHNGEVASPGEIRLSRAGNDYSGSYHFNLKDINLFVPWGNNMGVVDIKGDIFGTRDSDLSTEGHAYFYGERLAIPNFSHTLEQFRGDIIFKGLDIRLRSLTGLMGGGHVDSSGYMFIRDNQLQDMFLTFVGKNMDLYIDRVNFLLDTDINLKLTDKKILVSGRVHALKGLWKREMDEGLSFNTDPSLSVTGSRVMSMLEFDLKLTSNDGIQADNSLGKASGRYNLALTGNPDFPILTGVVECNSGEIDFSGKKFDVLKAKMVFNNKFMIDPLVNIEAESFIKNYRILFTISGVSSRLKPDLKSSPPLPARDILSLISLGELFQRPTSAELSSQIGAGTAGLIASGITDEIRKRTKNIFGNYMLRFDPNITNIAGNAYEMNSRLIVGKELSKDFIVVYATNFSSDSQQVIYLQYQISPNVSLIGMRNEKGKLSLDLRFRKRH